jgi:hypothetical protein
MNAEVDNTGTGRHPDLEDRLFGLPTATALVVGSLIGTGVFALPSALAPYGADQPGRVRAGHRRRHDARRLAQRAIIH